MTLANSSLIMSEIKVLTREKKSRLTKTYMDELFGTNVAYEEFTKPQDYQGFQMNFLKHKIQYKFSFPVQLSKTAYSYRVSRINNVDIVALNSIFKKFDRNLKIGEGYQFMNGKTVKFLDEQVLLLLLVIIF